MSKSLIRQMIMMIGRGSLVTPVISTDPNFNNVSLLLHMDGSSGSTTFIDQIGHTITPTSTTVSAAQTKFGSGSGIFDGTSSKLTGPVIPLGSSDFTIECWVYPTASKAANFFASDCDSSTNNGSFIFNSDTSNKLIFTWYTGASSLSTSYLTAGTMTINAWNHMAVCKHGTSIYGSINGTVELLTTSALVSMLAPSAFCIGSMGGYSGRSLQGYMDDFRLTVGVARYLTSFAVPTSPFPDALPTNYVEDVFSAYTYTGNGSSQTITNGIDLAGKGGMVWIKNRAILSNPNLEDTVRGTTKYLLSNFTNSEGIGSGGITSFTSTGFALSEAGLNVNTNNNSHVSWSFAQAVKFFKVAQVVVSGSNQTVDLSSLGTVGMVTVKRTDSTSAWYTLHRSNTAGKLCYLNTPQAETTDGSITLSGTTLTLVQSVIGNGTYIVYAWAHDTSTTGIIQCGSFTGTSDINLGWEPQYILYKPISNTSDWKILDTTRGLSIQSSSNAQELYTDLSTAEATNTNPAPTATGFAISGRTAGAYTYAYMAIRRGPMRQPTIGTQVFNTIVRTGTGATASVTGVGFPPDLVIPKGKIVFDTMPFDRLRGAKARLLMNTTGAEATFADSLTAFNMDGISVGADATNDINATPYVYANWFFRRYPGVFDEGCTTGTSNANARNAHNLGVIPELIINKDRSSGGSSWYVWHSSFTTSQYLNINTTTGISTSSNIWGTSLPTAALYGINETNQLGTGTDSYVTYLFATLANVSKVGSYTGNGSAQTINCNFSTGARFILIKRTDVTGGDWFVWDTARGITVGNDPHLSLNTAGAEVTADSSVDPANAGFIVNQVAATNVNVTSATYIYLAIA